MAKKLFKILDEKEDDFLNNLTPTNKKVNIGKSIQNLINHFEEEKNITRSNKPYSLNANKDDDQINKQLKSREFSVRTLRSFIFYFFACNYIKGTDEYQNHTILNFKNFFSCFVPVKDSGLNSEDLKKCNDLISELLKSDDIKAFKKLKIEIITEKDSWDLHYNEVIESNGGDTEIYAEPILDTSLIGGVSTLNIETVGELNVYRNEEKNKEALDKEDEPFETKKENTVSNHSSIDKSSKETNISTQKNTITENEGREQKESEKPIENQGLLRVLKRNFFASISLIILGIILIFNFPKLINISKTDKLKLEETGKTVQEKSKTALSPTFSDAPHDSLYILISSFKNQNLKLKKEHKEKQEELIGISIRRLVNRLIQKYSLPIAFDYKKEILPKDDESAKRICEYHNADILLWGYGYLDNNNRGDIRFRVTPSKKMKLNEGGEILKIDNKYNKGISLVDIEEGKLIIGNIDFESWLRSMLKIKVAKYNPEFFIISDTLSVKNKAIEFHKLSKIYKKLDKTDKAIEFITKSIQLDPLNSIFWAFRSECKEHSKKAIDDIKKAIELDAFNPEFRVQLAKIYAKRYNYVEAEKLYNKAIELDTFNSSLLLARASFYYREKDDYYKAEADFNRAIELEPTDYWLRYNRAEFYSKYKKYKKAEKDYEVLTKANSSNIFAWVNLAEFYKDFYKFEEAEAVYNKAIKQYPSHTFLLNWRANFYETINNYKKAEADYIRAAKLDSLNSSNWINLAEFYNKIKNRKKAEVYFNKALEVDTLDIYHLEKRADFYGYANIKKALNDYNRIIDLNALNPQSWITRADFLKNNDPVKAKEDYVKAITLIKSDIRKAGVYEKMGNYAKAEELYIKLVNTNKIDKIKRADFYERYAKRLWRDSYSRLYELIEEKEIEHYNKKNIKKTVELLKKAQDDYDFFIRSNPNDSNLLLLRAKFYTKIEKFKKAEEDYNKLETLIPHVLDFWKERAIFYQKSKKDYVKVINNLTQAIKLDSLNPYYLLYRAQLYQINKDTLRAESDYANAIRLNSFSPYNLLARARFYSSIKSNQKAEKDYIKAIELNPYDYKIWDARMNFYRSTRQKDKLIEDHKRVATLWYKDFSKVNKVMTSLKKMGENEVRIQIYTKLIKLDSLNSQHIRFRAMTYRDAKMYDKAIEDYTTLIRRDSTDFSNWLSRIHLHKKMKKYDKVKSDFNQLLTLDNSNPIWLYNLIDFNLEFENYREAEINHQRAITLDSTRIDSWRRRANFYHHQTFKFDKAEKDYTKIIELDSSDASLWYTRAKFYKELGLYKKATKDYSLAIEKSNAKKLNTLFVRASFYESIGEYEKAENDLNQIILIHFDTSYAIKQKRDFYSRIGNYEKSLSTHFEYLKADSISLEVERKHPGKNRYAGQYDYRDSGDYFKKMSDKNWKNLLSILMLRNSIQYFKDVKNYLEEEKYLSELIEFDEYVDPKRYKIQKAELYTRTKDYSKAITTYTEVLESSEKINFNLLINRAKIYHKLGENSKAEADFSKAIRLGTTNLDNLYQRAEFYKKEKYYKKAIVDYEKMLSSNFSYSHDIRISKNDLLFVLANLYRKINNIKKAEDYYSKIIQKDTLTPYYWKLRGDFYFSINQPEKGKNDIEIAKSLEYKYLSKARKLIDSEYIKPRIKRKEGHMAYFEKFEIAPYPETNSNELPNKDLKKYIKEITSDSSFFSLIKLKTNLSGVLKYHSIQKFNKLYTVEDYTQKIKLDSTNSYNWVLRGDYYVKINDPNNAILDYQKAILLDSTNTMRWKSKAQFHFKKQEYRIAINHFKGAITLFNLNDDELLHELWFEKARAHYKLKQYKVALQDVSKSNQLYPSYKTFFFLHYLYFINYWYVYILVLSIILITVKKFRVYFLK